MRSRLELGVVIKAHGVQGAVRLRLHNPASRALEGEQELILLKDGVERRVRSRHLGGAPGLALLELQGVTDRDAAEALRGARLLVDRASLPPLGADEYYYEDLIGCVVEDEQGGRLGEVAEVFSAGASDVLVVREGDEERLIPMVENWVVEVDPAARRIRVRGAEQFEPSKV